VNLNTSPHLFLDAVLSSGEFVEYLLTRRLGRVLLRTQLVQFLTQLGTFIVLLAFLQAGDFILDGILSSVSKCPKTCQFLTDSLNGSIDRSHLLLVRLLVRLDFSDRGHAPKKSGKDGSHFTFSIPMAAPVAALYNAILTDNVNTTRHILLNYPQLDLANAFIFDGKSPLILACLSPNSAHVTSFLSSLPEIDVNLQDANGETALFHACSVGNVYAVSFLLQTAALADLCNREHMTPLMMAAYGGHSDVCKVLLDTHRVDVNTQDQASKTALFYASYEGHGHVVTFLLAYGASINVIDQYGWTALMIAAFSGHGEVVQTLLKAGARRDCATANGKNALMLALEAGHSDVARLFPEYKYDKAQQASLTPAIEAPSYQRPMRRRKISMEVRPGIQCDHV
jgi:ankyrin repeat protein